MSGVSLAAARERPQSVVRSIPTLAATQQNPVFDGKRALCASKRLILVRLNVRSCNAHRRSCSAARARVGMLQLWKRRIGQGWSGICCATTRSCALSTAVR